MINKLYIHMHIYYLKLQIHSSFGNSWCVVTNSMMLVQISWYK